MAMVRSGSPLHAAGLRVGRFVDLFRSFPGQARLALGIDGVAWATVAGIVGLICGGASFAQVALSLHATEVEHRQQNAAEILALDQAARRLLRTVHLMSYGERQPAEVEAPLRSAWPQFQSALATVCRSQGSEALHADRMRSVCATGSAMRDILAPEIEAFDPSNRLIKASEFGKVIALVGDLNNLSTVVASDANALVGRMVDNYSLALLVLTLSTMGFAGAGLVLILLVSRASMRHFEQWRQATQAAREAGAARDSLQETIDALPAGVVLYDQQERLVMFNTAAVASSPLLKRPNIIGITYEELAHETGKLGQEFGAPLTSTPDEWIERFRSKGARRMRQSVEGRWFEWSEKLTASGRTVGLRVDITDLKTRELEIERTRDLLQETIDTLPAGVVVYDKDERLVMFNKVAASVSPCLALPDAIGKTYAELAYDDARLNEAAGIDFGESPEQWIARFHSKSTRHRRQIPDGRWIEWLEKTTQDGGTVGLRVDITEIKTRELEIERARDLLQETIDALPAGVVLYDRDERLVMFNKAAASMAPGLTLPGSVGKTYAELVHEAVRQNQVAGISSVDSPEQWIARFRSKGERQLRQAPGGRWVEWLEKGTQSGGTVGLRVDVTELKTRELELERAHAEYQSLVDSMSDAVYALNVKGAFTFVSAAAAELLGVPAARLVGARFLDYVAPEDIDQAAVAGRALVKSYGRAVYQTQIRMMTANRAIRHVEVRYRTPVDGVTRDAAQIGVIRDVEDRVQLTRRLDAEMARLRSIVESSGAMIVLVDRTLGVVMINSEFTAVTGLTRADTVGHPLNQVVDWPLEAAALGDWLSGRSGPDRAKPTRFATRMRDRQGRQRLIAVTATPVADERGRVSNIVFLGVDDTERREAEEALFDTERLATVGEMAATVAHEIAQPLQVIGVACASVQDELADTAALGSAPGREFLTKKIDRIQDQVDRAGRIIGDLRAFVRGTSQEVPVRFDPAVAVQGAVNFTQHAVRAAKVALSVSVADDLPMLVGHVGKLEQVLVNLINNACDAGGREVGISAAAPYQEGRRFLRIVVEDNGPGIAADVLPRLFESFVTTKPRGKGTGLGLRICRRIVEEMGGSISAGNRAGRGACFEILLPAAPAVE
jgi:PAS domain S-box-containing protein